MTLPIHQTTDQNFSRMQTTWSTQINPVINNPLMSGQLLQNNVITANQDNKINTTLDRPYTGWFLTRVFPKSTTQAYSPLGNWASYTPTITGCGTVTNLSAQYRRVGDSIFVHGSFTAGTVAASAFSISLPTSLAIDFTKCPSTQTNQAGFATRIRTAATYATAADGPFPLFTDGSNSLIYLALGGVATNVYNKSNGNGVLNSAENLGFQFNVPIVGYAAGDGDNFVWEVPPSSTSDASKFLNLHSANNLTVDVYVF